ncbi:MAG: CoA transferase subunit A [Ilumatobacteraceae bacterium]
MRSKVRPLSALGELVPDGATISLGGAWFANHPMAAVRELIRAGRRGLHVISSIGSTDVDLLVAAGAIDQLTFSMVTLEAFGLAPAFRRAVETQGIRIREMTGIGLNLALEAQGRGVPFLPFRGPAGSDLLIRNADVYAEIACPFTGTEMMAVRAISSGIAIIHATRADESGNAQWDGTFALDPEMAKAADRVIVTCEQIVSRQEIVDRAPTTQVPSFLVDTVIEAPYGAHPTSHAPLYAVDGWEVLEYAESARDGGDRLESFVHALRSETEDQYLARVLPLDRATRLRQLSDEAMILEPE